MRIKVFSFLLFSFYFLLPVHVFADWTQFRGDAHSTGVSTATLPDVLDVLWTASVEEGIESTAAIWQGTVYV
ncbi:MAG: hypothetical protein ACI8V2_003094, partial [Candidatus Latescibacterota bacterium]